MIPRFTEPNVAAELSWQHWRRFRVAELRQGAEDAPEPFDAEAARADRLIRQRKEREAE